MKSPFEGVELELDYPCRWSHKVVGRDEASVRAAVAAVLEGQEYDLVPSRQSRTGKYVSLELGFVARDQDHRQGIGQSLHDHPDVLFVI